MGADASGLNLADAIWMGAYIVGIFYLPVLAVVILFALVAKVARSNAK